MPKSENLGHIDMPEPRYREDLDYTIWEFDDHLLVVRGNVRDFNDTEVFPVYVKKTGKYGLDKAFTTEVEVDVAGIDASDISPTVAEPNEDDNPAESLY